MIIIIPLGGTGERFKKNNYNLPKALIKIFGKPIIYYLFDSLNLQEIDYVYIPYNKEYSNYNFESMIIKDYPNINFKFYKLKKNTRGAADTINLSIKKLDNIKNEPVICIDSDNFYNKHEILFDYLGSVSKIFDQIGNFLVGSKPSDINNDDYTISKIFLLCLLTFLHEPVLNR